MRDLQRARLVEETRPAPPRRDRSRRAGCGSPPDARARGARRDGPCCRDGPGPSASPDLVGAEQAAAGSRAAVGDADRIRRRHRPAERRHVRPAVFGVLRERAPHRHVEPRRQPGKDRCSAAAPVWTGGADTTAIGSGPRTAAARSPARRSPTPSEYTSERASTDAAGQLLGRRVGHGADELLRPGQPRLVAAAAVTFATPKSTTLWTRRRRRSRARRCWPASGRDG